MGTWVASSCGTTKRKKKKSWEEEPERLKMGRKIEEEDEKI
jgi:hypothetical protein